MFPSPLAILLLTTGIACTIFIPNYNNDAIAIVKNHMDEVVKACDAMNATAFLQLVTAAEKMKNHTLSMMIFGSYDYTVSEADYFNHGDIYTTVDMKKPEREMYMYFFLRRANPSPSGWTIYNVT